MKSCLGLLFTLLVFAIVVGGGALVWYLSDTAKFSRKAPTAVGAVKPTGTAKPPARR